MTSWRSVSISSLVASSCGALAGRASINATFPLGDGTGGLTDARPSVFSSVSASCCTLGRSALPFGVFTTIWKVPLKPGPNPCASRSYALRVVVDSGSCPASEEPRRSDSAGTASASITISAATPSTTRCSCTNRAHFGQNPSSLGSLGPCSASSPAFLA